MYGFGLGGSGQLGAKSTNNVNTPQVINGEWNQTQPTGVVVAKPDPPHCDTNTSVESMEDEESSQERKEMVRSSSQPLVVFKTFCGGDQSFVLVRPLLVSFESYLFVEM